MTEETNTEPVEQQPEAETPAPERDIYSLPADDLTDSEFYKRFGKRRGRFRKGNEYAWKKGQSGNPGGRPKKPKTMLRYAYLDALAEMDKSGLTVAEMIAVMMVRKAKKGNLAAAMELRKATEGDILNLNLVDQLKELAHQMGLTDDVIQRDPALAAIFAAVLPPSNSGAENVSTGTGAAGEEETEEAGPSDVD